MIKNHIRFIALAIGVLVSSMITNGAMAVPTGELKVVIDTPENAPATIQIGDSLVIAKGKKQNSLKRTIELTPGKFSVSAPSFVYQGQLFESVDAPKNIKVVEGEIKKLSIEYAAVGVAGSLGATKVSANEISLSWSNPDDVTFEIRRTKGKKIAKNVNAGVLISKSGLKTTDDNVVSGTTYTYALFSKIAGDWKEPISIRVSSSNSDTQTAAYASNPETVFVSGSVDYTVSWSGEIMAAQMPGVSEFPVIGTPYAFEQSEFLPDGFLGTVSGISADGSEIYFQSAGLGDAFNYFKLSTESDGSNENGSSLTCTSDSQVDSVVSVSATAYFNGSVEINLKGKKVWPNNQVQGNGSTVISGDFVYETDTDVHTVESVDCQTEFILYTQTLAVKPVPVNFSYSGNVNVIAESAVEISDISAISTTTIDFDSSISKNSLPSDDGSSETVIEFQNNPVLVDNGDVSIVASGVFGFGTANSMYGDAYKPIIGGEIEPFNGTNATVFAVLDSRFNMCQHVEGTSLFHVNANQKALVGQLTKYGSESVDDYSSGDAVLNWYIPFNCPSLNLPPGEQTIYGNGINQFDDNISDNPDQWNHFSLFNSGLSGWVLSTGNIDQIAQTPDHQASTPLGKPGDPLLDILSGQQTFDAVRYSITLKPTGSYLHIKYAFASEEYPEYVDQEFNDIMVILVNGTNCAFVPGTEVPVAINTINDHSNSEYYIDNWDSNPGELNVFDGMTVPLTCTAAVTPNQEVTVQIIVADAYDEVYDSAVALFDNGIWSDDIDH